MSLTNFNFDNANYFYFFKSLDSFIVLDATLSNMVSEPEPNLLDLQITKLSNQLMRPENVWLVRARFLNLKLKNWLHLLDCITKLVSDVSLATLVWLLQIMQENSMVQFIASSAMTGNSLHFCSFYIILRFLFKLW